MLYQDKQTILSNLSFIRGINVLFEEDIKESTDFNHEELLLNLYLIRLSIIE